MGCKGCKGMFDRRDLVVEKSRVAFVGTAYYQRVGKQPTAVDVQYVRKSECMRAPQVYELEVGEAWEPMPAPNAALVVVENLAGTDMVKQPSDEELLALQDQVLEVATRRTPHSLVHPGCQEAITPYDPAALTVRSRSGTITVKVTVFPG